MRGYRIAYFVVKAINVIIASIFIFIAAVINLMTKEEFRNWISENFIKDFSYRFLFCFCITIFFFLISLLANYLFRPFHGFTNKQMRKIALGEFTYYILFSIISILIPIVYN